MKQLHPGFIYGDFQHTHRITGERQMITLGPINKWEFDELVAVRLYLNVVTACVPHYPTSPEGQWVEA